MIQYDFFADGELHVTSQTVPMWDGLIMMLQGDVYGETFTNITTATA